MERKKWIEVAREALAGHTADLKCPVCGHSTLDAEWLPFAGGAGGGYRLLCRNCGAKNFVLKNHLESEA